VYAKAQLNNGKVEETSVSGIEINSVLIENRLFKPSAEFAAKARIKPDDLKALHQQAEDDYEGFWADQAKQHIDWHTPFTVTLDDSNAPHYRWFTEPMVY